MLSSDALKKCKLQFFGKINGFKRESVYRGSRFDFHISEESGKEWFLEVKSVTLVKDRIAMFPDAPTER